MNAENIKSLITPVLKKFNVIRAGLFGSYSRKNESLNSDVDVLVELGEDLSLLDFVKIKFALEDALNRKVDLVEYKSLKPALKDSILAEEIRIYG